MNRRTWSLWNELTIWAFAVLATSGCQWRTPPPGRSEGSLPPAYTRNQITDPTLRHIAEEIRSVAGQQVGAGGQALYSKIEVLPPARTVQPYGVGAFQQEPRLPVILTIGPGWAGLKREDKEAKAAEMFRMVQAKLNPLKRQQPLRPTVTIQTPQGMELAWINHLDPSGKHLHGDE